MPLYDYECKSCGVIEILHGMTEDDKEECPECGDGIKKAVPKQAPPAHYKGGGFYCRSYPKI